MVSERVRDYEIVMVLTPEASEDEATAIVDRVSNFISQRGGSISAQDSWGVRRLAYPIRGFLEGNYVVARFVLDAKDVLELDRTINASEDILRHLVTKLDKSVK